MNWQQFLLASDTIDGREVDVFRFPSEELQRRFVREVGGAALPGCRVALPKDQRCKLDDNEEEAR